MCHFPGCNFLETNFLEATILGRMFQDLEHISKLKACKCVSVWVCKCALLGQNPPRILRGCGPLRMQNGQRTNHTGM